MSQFEAEINTVFHAVSDPTRRSIIERIGKGELTLKELSRHYNMTFQAVAKHLKVLDEAGIITKKKVGREILCSLNPESLVAPSHWINTIHNFWDSDFESVAEFLNSVRKGN